jgi:phospholipase D1/2
MQEGIKAYEPFPRTYNDSILKTGHNCWRVEVATHASMIIDCADYYRALHQAIGKARRSVFVLGWDIDSRIELLRGEEARNAAYPYHLFDLIQWKVRQNPEVMVYLNRWDYSLYLAAEREGLSKIRWRLRSPPNVHYCLDDVIPVGACHHQKIVVIDDETAFCGGMDIALGRWDRRQHHLREESRIDPGGTYAPGTGHRFGPHHDIMMVVAGPAAYALGELARERWRLATGKNPIPMQTVDGSALPGTWPSGTRPDFYHVRIGIALTRPAFAGQKKLRQVEQLYFDMIDHASQFIYMENQFFSQQAIAAALNRQLRQKQRLRILMVSCYNPEGILERKSMYHGRVHFQDLVKSGGVGSRAALAYPICREQAKEEPVRIHSKVMIVDDMYLRVGSSNINNRSMALDTECDLMIEADRDEVRQRIAAIRNDLIREHTGRETRDIEKIIQNSANAEKFLNYITSSRQHLRQVNDERYRYEKLAWLITRIADPDRPFPSIDPRYKRPLSRSLLVALAVATLTLLWYITPLAHYATPENMVPLLEQIRGTPWIIPATLTMFIIGSLVFLPHLVMTGVTVILFAPLKAFLVAMTGSLLSAAVGFLLGRKLGMKSLQALVGPFAGKISHYTRKGGVMGLALLRMIPLAPFTIVNMVLGMSQVTLPVFMFATFFGLFPGILAFALLGHSLSLLIEDPDRQHLLYAGAGILGWAAIVVSAHFLVRYLQKRLGYEEE